MPYHVSAEQFGELVAKALEDIPPAFARQLEEVPVEVRDCPTKRHLEQTDIKDDQLLLGLYVGHARTHRHVEDSAVLPDVIYIFQKNIEQVCHNEAELIEQVRITVLHEIGHHFGLDEDDLDNLGYG